MPARVKGLKVARPEVRIGAALVSCAAIAAVGAATATGSGPVITEYTNGVSGPPTSIAAGPDGNVWFTVAGATPAIGLVTPTGQITEYTAGLNQGGQPGDITVGPDGNLWFTDTGDPRMTASAIGRITPRGQITEYSNGLNPGSRPGMLVAGTDGNLWFTDTGDPTATTPMSAIGRITPSGQITEYSNGLNPHSTPVRIVVGPGRNLWFTDQGGVFGGASAVGRVTPAGQITEYTAGLNSGSSPYDITVGPDGNLWFTDSGINGTMRAPAIGRVTSAGQITEYTAGLNNGSNPVHIVAGADGNLWFTDMGSPDEAIGHVTPSGQITEHTAGPNPIPPGADAGGYPAELVSGPDGNVWFTDGGSPDSIGQVTPAGEITNYTSGLHPGSTPVGVVAAPDGNLWFTDPATPAIGEVRLNATAPTAVPTPAPTPVQVPVVSSPLRPVLPTVLTGPRVTGLPVVGRLLTCVAPKATGASRVTFTWRRAGRAIHYANRARYRVVRADRGKLLSCVAHLTGPGGTTVSVSHATRVRGAARGRHHRKHHARVHRHGVHRVVGKHRG